MRASALLAALALTGCNGQDPLAFPTLLDPAPFAAQRDGDIATDTDLDAVAVGLPVTLRSTVPGVQAFSWTLQVPPGSTAQLAGATTASPTFTPDVEGAYRVGLNGAASRRITAATYLGIAACASCHTTRAAGFALTDHARSMELRGSVLFSVQGCFTCHVVDPAPAQATAATGGFEDESALAGLDPATYTYASFATFRSDFPAVANVSGVQCESCHGPGSGHDGDPRGTAMTLRATLCGDCHSGFVGPNRLLQWQNSGHGREPPAAALQDPSCRKCHAAQGFLDHLAGAAPSELSPGAPGVTCAVCHQPHNRDNPAQTRVWGTAPITSGGFYNGGRAAACITCHQSNVPDALAHADANLAFPCAVQADMLTSRGAVEYGLSFGVSFHGTTVFRLRPFTGDPDDSNDPDACVVCHMAPSGDDALGGHAMAQRSGGVPLATGNCDRCHPGLDTFDRSLGKDFDGNGRAQGVQTEVNGLLSILLASLRNADGNGALTQPGGAGTEILVAADPVLSTPALRRAVYNYNFVALDGSRGVHNTAYAVQLLQRTYGQLTGTPFQTAFPNAALR